MDLILRTEDTSFPFKRFIKNCGFEDWEYGVIPDDFKISDLFKSLGISKSQFNKGLKEGRIYKDYKVLLGDSLLEKGITNFKFGLRSIDIWLPKYKRKLSDYIIEVIDLIFFIPINILTYKLFKKKWL